MREAIVSNRLFIAAIAVVIVVLSLNVYKEYNYNEAKKDCANSNRLFVEGVCYKLKFSR